MSKYIQKEGEIMDEERATAIYQHVNALVKSLELLLSKAKDADELRNTPEDNVLLSDYCNYLDNCVSLARAAEDEITTVIASF